MVSGSYELPLMRPALLDIGVEATGDALLSTSKWLAESSKRRSPSLSVNITQSADTEPTSVSASNDFASFGINSSFERER